MGNHTVGRAMAKMAEIALNMRTNQTALDLLDDICEPYRNCDAEFEGSTEPNMPLGKLMAEAFTPNTDWISEIKENVDDDQLSDRWYEEVYRPFRKRYDFW